MHHNLRYYVGNGLRYQTKLSPGLTVYSIERDRHQSQQLVEAIVQLNDDFLRDSLTY